MPQSVEAAEKKRQWAREYYRRKKAEDPEFMERKRLMIARSKAKQRHPQKECACCGAFFRDPDPEVIRCSRSGCLQWQEYFGVDRKSPEINWTARIRWLYSEMGIEDTGPEMDIRNFPEAEAEWRTYAKPVPGHILEDHYEHGH